VLLQNYDVFYSFLQYVYHCRYFVSTMCIVTSLYISFGACGYLVSIILY